MLTDQQALDVRRYAGYPLTADTPVDDTRDFAYGWVSPGVWQTLFHRLNNLQPAEESTLINVYLVNLNSLEAAVPTASDNLDTDQAAVWYHNKNEMSDRLRLFDEWRCRMCDFIGIQRGPFLVQQTGGGRVIRT